MDRRVCPRFVFYSGEGWGILTKLTFFIATDITWSKHNHVNKCINTVMQPQSISHFPWPARYPSTKPYPIVSKTASWTSNHQLFAGSLHYVFFVFCLLFGRHCSLPLDVSKWVLRSKLLLWFTNTIAFEQHGDRFCLRAPDVYIYICILYIYIYMLYTYIHIYIYIS